MSKRVLITGGAGFIGSHLADELTAHGYRVRALDCLLPQVHGPGHKRPAYLNESVELTVGDVRDREAVEHALEGVSAVFHLAAAVGVGQSMYEVARYTEINDLGTAVLMEALIRRPVRRLIVASSMSVYGEGLYRTADGALMEPPERTREQLAENHWELRGPGGEQLTPIPTPETKHPALSSVYALGKYDQERVCLLLGSAYGIPTVALRFFNVYGTRQALSNPYTGALAIFASRLLNKKPPLIFEDGLQQRDFVSVRDVARACRLALEVQDAAGQVLNIGSGRPATVRAIATQLADILGRSHLRPEITGRYRTGDIRHCFGDITRARRILGYEPRVQLQDGLAELAEWLGTQRAVDRVDQMRAELESRGLTV